MPSVFDGYPYSNTHQLNLDWIIAQIKQVSPLLEELKKTLEAVGNFDEVLDDTKDAANKANAAAGRAEDAVEQLRSSTVNEIPILDNPVLTAAIVGAAPEGLAAGHYSLASIDAVNATIAEVMSRMDPLTVKFITWTGTGSDAFSSGIPYNTDNWTVALYKERADNYGVVYMCSSSAKGVSAVANVENGSVSGWRWINPPLTIGVEFAINEFFNGYPVFCKYVDFGSLPASGDKSSRFSSAAARVVSVDGFAISPSGTLYPFPFYSSAGVLNGSLSFSKYNLFVTAYADISNFTGYAVVKYIKTEA